MCHISWLRIGSLTLAFTAQFIDRGDAQTRGYIANARSNNVSVIDTDGDVVIATIPVGGNPGGIAVHPDGIAVYRQSGRTPKDAPDATNLLSACSWVGTPATSS